LTAFMKRTILKAKDPSFNRKRLMERLIEAAPFLSEMRAAPAACEQALAKNGHRAKRESEMRAAPAACEQALAENGHRVKREDFIENRAE
ncbi:MAG: hypothetical protein Q4A51_08555, partial [Lachnospiraceae bacterium]|nr:hypothetical protein [Lachnospiraceae bacterium]